MIYLWRLVKEHKPNYFTVIFIKKWAIDLIRDVNKVCFKWTSVKETIQNIIVLKNKTV